MARLQGIGREYQGHAASGTAKKSTSKATNYTKTIEGFFGLVQERDPRRLPRDQPPSTCRATWTSTPSATTARLRSADVLGDAQPRPEGSPSFFLARFEVARQIAQEIGLGMPRVLLSRPRRALEASAWPSRVACERGSWLGVQRRGHTLRVAPRPSEIGRLPAVELTQAEVDAFMAADKIVPSGSPLTWENPSPAQILWRGPVEVDSIQRGMVTLYANPTFPRSWSYKLSLHRDEIYRVECQDAAGPPLEPSDQARWLSSLGHLLGARALLG